MLDLIKHVQNDEEIRSFTQFDDKELYKNTLSRVIKKYVNGEINFTTLYGKTIGRGNLRLPKLNLTNMKKHIREYVLDSIHHHKWIYYKNFDDMLEKFQTFEYKEEFGHNDCSECWNIFTIRYITNNWKMLTITDFTEKQVEVTTEYCEKYPNLDPWNTTIISHSILLKDQLYRECYYELLHSLECAHLDSILLTRSRDEWKLIYQCRYQMIPYDNLWFDRVNLYQTIDENLFYCKFKDNSEFNHLLSIHQPVYTKDDIPLEYFPRERSRPKYEYAYIQYWIDNEEIKVIPNILSTRELLNKSRKERDDQYIKDIETYK